MLFTRIKTWKQPKYLSGRWMYKENEYMYRFISSEEWHYVNYKEDPTIDYVKKNKPDTEKEIAFLSYKIHNFINYMW